MARPQKDSLEYFPFDVDIFEDEKLFDVSNEYGPLGEVIYFRLLCLIYKNGYYYKFESLDKLAAMLIKSIGNKWARDKQSVMQVIPFLAKCNLFSIELMQENVLTSASIQRRFLKATERRQTINSKEYWLLSIDNSRITVAKSQINVCNNGVNVYNNSKNVDNNGTKESKVKESKVKESKVKDINNNTSSVDSREIVKGEKTTRFIPPTIAEIISYCVERKNKVNAEKLFNFYESKDWMVGKNKMKNWKACVRTWEQDDKNNFELREKGDERTKFNNRYPSERW